MTCLLLCMYLSHYINEIGRKAGKRGWNTLHSCQPCHVARCSEPPGHSQSHTFLALLTSPFFFLLISSSPPFAPSPCPVTEPSVWTDRDIGCVGDRLAGVISEGEKNRSVSLYLTPSLLHQSLMKEGLTGDSSGCIIYFSEGGYLSWRAFLSSRSPGNSINKNKLRRKLRI